MFLTKMTSAALFTMVLIAPAFAEEPTTQADKPLSFKECGAQYQAAKKADALGGKKWMEYRTEVCRIAAPANRQAAKVRSEATSNEAVSRLVFPTALASEFSTEKPWKARMRTCLKSYRQAKQDGALYGVKWVQKGGGYYSLCTARLREQTKA